MLEEYMRKARLENPGDGKFIGLHEKYFNLFKDPISFEDDGNGNNVGDDDDGNGDDGDDDANDGDGNVDENDANECDKNPNGSNQSFGFNKISLDDFGNDSGLTESEPVDPTKQGTVCDLFGDNSAAREALNEVVTPQIQPTQKRVVKPSSYVLSSYMNKKTNVVPKITKMEFIVGNSLFAMQGDKLFTMNLMKFTLKSHEIQSESHEIQSESHEIIGISLRMYLKHNLKEVVLIWQFRLNLETLSPSLWLDANTESMLDGTFTSFDEKWKRFSDQVNAQFNGNEGGRGLEGIDLVFFPICNSQHFYVVVFSLTKTTTMTILDNSPGTYDSKYKDVCDLLNESHEIHSESHKIHSESHKIQSESHEIRKDLMRLIFESHLYGHPRHATVARVKHTIPKVKWKTKENFYDCGIFTMLHMENFNGGPASDFDCGLPVESQLQLDILRRLRFKFATKILLHEINLQSEKMVEFAKEFDKKGPSEKISIIIDAIKNREERDRIDN
ncbi:ulp1 protease family, C-terminal catalytic domain-containing protein [Tanacetum coccineum]